MRQAHIVKVLNAVKHPEYLRSVIQLWRIHSDTLGFFPEGAFHEYAAKKLIVVAVDHNDNVVGYVLYRVSAQKVTIAHLCVSERSRGYGLSRLLLSCLRNETKGLKGIGLFCRRDYSVNTLWPRLGFVPVAEKKGRGKTQETLTYWWLDYRTPDLFTEAVTNDLKENIALVIDANVFYDLDENNGSEQSVESKALDADWFKGEVAIFVTDEIYTEINRRQSETERGRQRERVHAFNVLESNVESVNALEKEMAVFLRRPRKAQDVSDIRQLSHAIAAKADYFITRDEYLLKQADRIYEKYALNIRRPAEIIIEVDSLHDEVRYRPARLAGTLASLRLVNSGDVDCILEHFCLHKRGEKKKQLAKKLATIMGQPEKYKVVVAMDSNGAALAIYAISRPDGSAVNICFARVREGALGLTLARYILAKLIREASSDVCDVMVFSDVWVQSEFVEALQEEGFLPSGSEWVRLVVNSPIKIQGLESIVADNAPCMSAEVYEEYSRSLIKKIEGAKAKSEKYSLVELERLIWPGKILDIEVPCFIVPIKPYWARELFDENLANQDLFGAELNLAIQNEGVYYYSIRGAKTSAPARILWYVSGDRKIPGSSAIRACSLLKEVVVDTPKPLFKRYRRLGVYKWEDVLNTAGNDLSNRVVAMHFGNTELFRTPIGWSAMQECLRDIKGNKSIITATPVPTEVFMKIYGLGMRRDA